MWDFATGLVSDWEGRDSQAVTAGCAARHGKRRECQSNSQQVVGAAGEDEEGPGRLGTTVPQTVNVRLVTSSGLVPESLVAEGADSAG